jgi:sulfate adenylyltransferase subunit 2
MQLGHLNRLEAESFHMMCEVVAECERPVMLYSIGKDSSVMLHLAMKAFHPSKPPFPLLHVDATWKFRDMIEFRDRRANEAAMELLVQVNPRGFTKDAGLSLVIGAVDAAAKIALSYVHEFLITDNPKKP